MTCSSYLWHVHYKTGPCNFIKKKLNFNFQKLLCKTDFSTCDEIQNTLINFKTDNSFFLMNVTWHQNTTMKNGLIWQLSYVQYFFRSKHLAYKTVCHISEVVQNNMLFQYNSNIHNVFIQDLLLAATLVCNNNEKADIYLPLCFPPPNSRSEKSFKRIQLLIQL